jgi:hypothetical protein
MGMTLARGGVIGEGEETLPVIPIIRGVQLMRGINLYLEEHDMQLHRRWSGNPPWYSNEEGSRNV